MLFYTYMCMHLSEYVNKKVKSPTVVESDPKASFSIATTLRCREGHYFFPWIAPLYFDPYLIMLSVKQDGIKYHFLSLWYDSTWDWTPSPGPLANTLLIRPICMHVCMHNYAYVYANAYVHFNGYVLVYICLCVFARVHHY